VPRTVEVLTVCYVGGRGTLFGSLFAGFLLVGFQEYFRELEAWRLVMYGALLIAVMLFAPKGLAALKKSVWSGRSRFRLNEALTLAAKIPQAPTV
jgi:branched-chain amino acid transport system permease protein